VEQRRPTTFTSILARVWQRSPVAPEGLAASGVSLGEIAGLAPDVLEQLGAATERV